MTARVGENRGHFSQLAGYRANTDTVQRHRSSCRTRRHQVASASVRLGGAAHTQAAERRRRVGLRVVHVVDERLEVRSRGLQVVEQQVTIGC